MAACFEPKTSILPKAQKEIWPLLAPAPGLSFVLYGGTAVGLHLGHRTSVDFDFFRSSPLDKAEIATSFQFMAKAQTISGSCKYARYKRANAVGCGKDFVFWRHDDRQGQ